MYFGDGEGKGKVYQGKFIDVKWCDYRDKVTGEEAMRLECPIELTIGDETGKVYPTLWFGTGIVEVGNDKGMTQTESSLRTLNNYGLRINLGDPADNNASGFPEALEGMDATVWAETKDDGTVKAYLNSPSRAMKADDVDNMWAKITGQEAVNDLAGTAPDAPADDDDGGLPF